jgi:hypothetical protein
MEQRDESMLAQSFLSSKRLVVFLHDIKQTRPKQLVYLIDPFALRSFAIVGGTRDFVA